VQPHPGGHREECSMSELTDSPAEQSVQKPILYHRPRPITLELDRGLSLQPLTDFRFARATNSVVLGAVELVSAMHQFPIVFTTAGRPGALAVLGVERNLNL